MSHETNNGYGTRPCVSTGIAPIPRKSFVCQWLVLDAQGVERPCGVRFESTSPNAAVCPHHRHERDLIRQREYKRQAVARRKAVG